MAATGSRDGGQTGTSAASGAPGRRPPPASVSST